jgi:hypothetical protein
MAPAETRILMIPGESEERRSHMDEKRFIEHMRPANSGAQNSPSRSGALVANLGSSPLNLTYWNAEGAWVNVVIPAGSSTDIVCSKCVGSITIAFNDGKQNRTMPIGLGEAYKLFWSESQAVWDIANVAN